jgi:hypothetical protein
MGPSPKPKEPEPPHEREAAQLSQRRQELMRQLSREVPSETERDTEIERDSAIGGNRPGAGASPEPEPGQPQTHLTAKSFWYTGGSLRKRRTLPHAFWQARLKEAKEDFTQWTMPQRLSHMAE